MCCLQHVPRAELAPARIGRYTRDMLLPIDHLIDLPVMSLQTGTELARTVQAILDPRQMKIAAFYVDGPLLEDHPSILHPADIRELSDIGMIIDSSDQLMSLEGLVRLEEIIGLKFELIGMKVIDEHKRKLGKVSNYIVEPGDYTIQQIYTQQSLLRSLSTATNIIRRSQIVAVRKDAIIVKSPTVKDEVEEVAQTAQAFVNPFRGSQPES